MILDDEKRFTNGPDEPLRTFSGKRGKMKNDMLELTPPVINSIGLPSIL